MAVTNTGASRAQSQKAVSRAGAAVALKLYPDYDAALREARGQETEEIFAPNPAMNELYQKKQREMNELYRRLCMPVS